MAYIRCSGNIGGSLKVRTASGNPCTFTTDLADALVSLTADVVCGQDLHGYDHPWPAGGGKNKLNYDAWKNLGVNGGTAVYENNGITITALTNDAYTYWTNDVFPQGARVSINEGETITLSWNEPTNKSGLVYIFPNGEPNGLVAESNTVAKKISYTATEGVTYITFRFGVDNQGDTIAYKNIQIEKGSQATPYEPYSNICPLVGHSELNLTRCGVNLWNEETRNGYYNTNGTFTADSNYLASKNYIPVVPNTEYHFESAGGKFGRLCWYDKDKTFVSTDVPQSVSINITSPANASYLQFDMQGAYGATYNHDISINYPSTDTTYHAYNGQTFTVAFGQTVYGGVYDKSGRLTITHFYIKGGFTQYNASNGYKAYMRNDLPLSKYIEHGKSNMVNEFGSFDSSAMDRNIIQPPYGSGTCYLALEDTANADDVELVYELATPIVIDVPSISVFAENGMNNITSDCGGDVDVSYLELIRGT